MRDPQPNRSTRALVPIAVALATVVATVALVYPSPAPEDELPNRIPEPAPYVVAEAAFSGPPFEEYWQGPNHPGQCRNCHQAIFDEWNGSMMANAWRDPAWRAAFLLSARQISTNGNCDTPAPPDGTEKARHNPFAVGEACETRFDLGATGHTLARSGSLADGLCSRCHMPTNYVDNVPLHEIRRDEPSGLEHAPLDVHFNPTSDNGTGLAFATVDAQWRNTDSGKSGVACMVCHTLADSRNTPYHNFAAASRSGYAPAAGRGSRTTLVAAGRLDATDVPDPGAPSLGYGVGAGAYRLSAHAVAVGERLGPLFSPGRPPQPDGYLTAVFKRPLAAEPIEAPKHEAFRNVFSTRAEFCSTCHDVTNPLTVRNRLGKWVGGFPIERTYAEWASSRYADRPGNRNFDPAFKRDCQTCHMQQDYGKPGTAQTLYKQGAPIAPLTAVVATGGPARTYFSHHFVGGNAYVPHILGADLDATANIEPYPELSTFSFSSADEKSVYHNAYWKNTDGRGAPSQQTRLAWDRLRHVLALELSGPTSTRAGTSAPIVVSVTNSGSGHNFPTGFPEGRVAWLAISAYDLATGLELPIHDSFWNRTSMGVGRFTTTDVVDPSFPGCGWKIPAGSPDPFAYQFKAVATLGDDCPTLELVYATARNLVTNANGIPIDTRGVAIDRDNPLGLPIFRDVNGNGDRYDDAFLRDTRLRPLPHAGATVTLDRYSVVIPPGTRGPVALSATVYYQSIEAIVAKKFLGNLADTNLNFTLETCVLGGRCDGRHPRREPAVVEGAPPVPMEVRNWVIRVDGAPLDPAAPVMSARYPVPGAVDVFQDVVPKVTFAEPIAGLSNETFTLTDAAGTLVPASVDHIGDGTWALFPDRVFLTPGETYTARVSGRVCGLTGRCTTHATAWAFTVTSTKGGGDGDTSVPPGFPRPESTRHGVARATRLHP